MQWYLIWFWSNFFVHKPHSSNSHTHNLSPSHTHSDNSKPSHTHSSSSHSHSEDNSSSHTHSDDTSPSHTHSSSSHTHSNGKKYYYYDGDYYNSKESKPDHTDKGRYSIHNRYDNRWLWRWGWLLEWIVVVILEKFDKHDVVLYDDNVNNIIVHVVVLIF